MAEEISIKEMNTPPKDTSKETKNNDEIKRDMYKIISELKQKMQEIDVITRELEEKRNELQKSNPQKTKKLLEELKVPALEILK